MRYRGSGGFTLIETMIVLTISGVMFVAFAGMMIGRQSEAQFQSSVSDLVTKIRSHINEVSSGFYVRNGNMQCTATPGAVPVVTAAASQLGTNSNCTYLGQAMMFDTQAGSDPEQYVVHSLVGNRLNVSSKEPMSLQEARTRALDPGSVYSSAYPSLATQDTLTYGLTLVWMRNGTGPGPTSNIAGFAIATAPNNQLGMSEGALQSGTVIPTIIPIPNAGGAVSRTQGVDLIARSLGGAAPAIPAPAGPVRLCFLSGTIGNRSALITVDTDGSVQSQIFTSGNCL